MGVIAICKEHGMNVRSCKCMKQHDTQTVPCPPNLQKLHQMQLDEDEKKRQAVIDSITKFD